MMLKELVEKYNNMAAKWNEVRVKMAQLVADHVMIAAEKRFLEDAGLTLSVGQQQRYDDGKANIIAHEQLLVITGRRLLLLMNAMTEKGMDIAFPDGTPWNASLQLEKKLSGSEVLSIVCFPLFKEVEVYVKPSRLN
jgi:hypothetical protein